jgi:hypothetical protein
MVQSIIYYGGQAVAMFGISWCVVSILRIMETPILKINSSSKSTKTSSSSNKVG